MNSFSFVVPCWCAGLEASRDVKAGEKAGFLLVLGWLESWRLSRGLGAGVESARAFWKAQALGKRREQWQLDQWAEAIR